MHGFDNFHIGFDSRIRGDNHITVGNRLNVKLYFLLSIIGFFSYLIFIYVLICICALHYYKNTKKSLFAKPYELYAFFLIKL